jgi:transposase
MRPRNTAACVEPTNNHAERGLRGAVIYRKLSLSSESEEGERTIERPLSASVTCCLQGRSLFAYLSDVLAAKIRGHPGTHRRTGSRTIMGS